VLVALNKKVNECVHLIIIISMYFFLSLIYFCCKSVLGTQPEDVRAFVQSLRSQIVSISLLLIIKNKVIFSSKYQSVIEIVKAYMLIKTH